MTVTVLLGVIIMIALTTLSTSRYTAFAQVDGGPGGSVEAALDVSSDVANRYVQTELVQIEILAPAFAEAMRTDGLTPSPVSATQQGTTNIIALGANGANADEAARKANVALDVYIADWRKRSEEELRRLLDNTNVRIEEVRGESTALGSSTEDAAQRRGLEAQLSRLTQERSDLIFRIGGVKAANRIVQQATPADAVRSTPLLQAALIGLLAGLAVGLAYVLISRARRLSQPGGDQ